ncbi:MAG TPA: hypothetical protein VMD98_11435 [Bryocella sp.]|nr:hypothetical protein [Bryocella sp.]
MPGRELGRADYEQNVFINCPFDDDYRPQRLGSRLQKRKSCLVLDRDPYRYQEFISDITGQDIASHSGEPAKAIGAVRNWLATSIGNQTFPGGRDIAARFGQFQRDLPDTCLKLKIQRDELTFAEYSRITFDWLFDNLTA